jgi:hypothetical protein
MNTGNEVKFINLTPHTINIFDEGGKEQVLSTPPSGTIARCTVENIKIDEKKGIPLFKSSFGEVIDLPDPKDGTIYIVSMLIRSALPNRKDLASPGQLLRDEDGRPIGCKGLSVN